MATKRIATLLGATCFVRFGHLVAMCCDMLGVVGPSLKIVKFEPTTPNMSPYAALACCDRLAGP